MHGKVVRHGSRNSASVVRRAVRSPVTWWDAGLDLSISLTRKICPGVQKPPGIPSCFTNAASMDAAAAAFLSPRGGYLVSCASRQASGRGDASPIDSPCKLLMPVEPFLLSR